jgi:hypothetical protein
MSTIVTRFAPSPTGYLHVGGARTALFNWLLARNPAANSSCASKTPTRPAPLSRPATSSSKTSSGSAFSGTILS